MLFNDPLINACREPSHASPGMKNMVMLTGINETFDFYDRFICKNKLII
ncbi:MAG: hypothetical protein JW723_04840 [Bacteroidales bacterium]|nr:hypothetical protein [Bacteroidales bacterium]